MATYNGGKFIREQVDSILNQEFTENEGVEIELVVSDDGSTDDTIQILESYHDPRIKIFMHRTRRSISISMPIERLLKTLRMH